MSIETTMSQPEETLNKTNITIRCTKSRFNEALDEYKISTTKTTIFHVYSCPFAGEFKCTSYIQEPCVGEMYVSVFVLCGI